MTNKNLARLNNQIVALYRHGRGDTLTSIAAILNMTPQGVTGLLTRARLDFRVIHGAELMKSEADRQLSFDFPDEPLYRL